MRDLAVALGVSPKAILIDRSGLSTRATVRNAKQIADGRGFRRVLAVSQPWHLPRIRMTGSQEGLPLLTVPARSTRPIRRTPLLVVREGIAFWAYWLRLV